MEKGYGISERVVLKLQNTFLSRTPTDKKMTHNEQKEFLATFSKNIQDAINSGEFGTPELKLFQNFFFQLGEDSYLFKLQNGPISEAGVNGCQIDVVLEWCRKQIDNFNKCFPCRESSLAITKIDEALHWLAARTHNRIARGVEGKAVL
jgi:hypothetical protein